MVRKSRSRLKTFVLIGLGLATQACAPLTQGNNSLSSCVGSYLSNSTSVGLGQTGAQVGTGIGVNTTSLAQSFVATSSSPIAELSVQLQAVLPTTATTLSGNITAEIEPDQLSTPVSPTPSTPAGVDVSTNEVTANGSIAASTVSASNFQFYTFSFAGGSTTGGTTASPTPVQGVELTAGQIYWIVLTSQFGTSATAYIEWSASTSPPTNTISKYLSAGFWQPLGNGISFDYKLGC